MSVKNDRMFTQKYVLFSLFCETQNTIQTYTVKKYQKNINSSNV